MVISRYIYVETWGDHGNVMSNVHVPCLVSVVPLDKVS